MSLSDPLGDMLTRIRNAQRARHSMCMSPASQLRANVLGVFNASLSPFALIHEFGHALDAALSDPSTGADWKNARGWPGQTHAPAGATQHVTIVTKFHPPSRGVLTKGGFEGGSLRDRVRGLTGE